jgi:hypothetical protein
MKYHVSSEGTCSTHSEVTRVYSVTVEGGVVADVHYGDYRIITIHHQDSATDIQSDLTMTF